MAGKNAPNFSALCELFGVLSDQTRLRVLLMLADGPSNVTALCEGLGLAQPTVSHHLGLLRMNRLVTGKRQGKQVLYTLEANAKATAGKLKVSLPPYTVTLETK